MYAFLLLVMLALWLAVSLYLDHRMSSRIGRFSQRARSFASEVASVKKEMHHEFAVASRRLRNSAARIPARPRLGRSIPLAKLIKLAEVTVYSKRHVRVWYDPEKEAMRMFRGRYEFFAAGEEIDPEMLRALIEHKQEFAEQLREKGKRKRASQLEEMTPTATYEKRQRASERGFRARSGPGSQMRSKLRPLRGRSVPTPGRRIS